MLSQIISFQYYNISRTTRTRKCWEETSLFTSREWNEHMVSVSSVCVGLLTCAILSSAPPRAAAFALSPVARNIRHETCAPTRGAGGRAEMSAPNALGTQLLLPIASSAAVGVILFAAAGRAPANRLVFRV